MRSLTFLFVKSLKSVSMRVATFAPAGGHVRPVDQCGPSPGVHRFFFPEGLREGSVSLGHAQGQGSWASSVPVRDGPLPATAGLSGSQGFWSGVVAVAFTKRDSSPGVVGPSLQESDRHGPPLPCPPQSPGPTCRQGRCLCRWRWAPRRAVSSPPVPCWACCAGGGRGARGEWGGA